LCEATHWRRANTLQALLEVLVSKLGGDNYGYTATISCKRAAIVPTECQINGANSAKCSLYLLNSIKALSLLSAYFSSSMYLMIDCFSSSLKLAVDNPPGYPPPILLKYSSSFSLTYLIEPSPVSE
jgi:hypothetical protein